MHLGFQPVVLKLEQVDLTPQVVDDLLLGVQLDHWLVLDVHRSARVVKGRERFFSVLRRWANAGYHQSLGRPTETVHEEHGELRVAIRDVLALQFLSIAPAEHTNDLAESEEALVDVSCLLDHRLPFGLGFFKPLAAGQVDEGDLSVLLVDESIVLIHRLRDEIHCQDAMRAR